MSDPPRRINFYSARGTKFTPTSLLTSYGPLLHRHRPRHHSQRALVFRLERNRSARRRTTRPAHSPAHRRRHRRIASVAAIILLHSQRAGISGGQPRVAVEREVGRNDRRVRALTWRESSGSFGFVREELALSSRCRPHHRSP